MHSESTDIHRRIPRFDSVESLHLEYLCSDSEVIESLRKMITEKKFRIRDTDQSYRVINHWSSLGLLDDERESNESSWRLFNVLQLVWIKAMNRMRFFGLPIELIKKAKTSFVFERNEDIFQGVFEFYVARTFVGGKTQLIIFDDGTSCIALEEEVHAWQAARGLANHLVINIYEIVEELFPKLNIRFKHNSGLSSDELELLLFIRSKDFETIEIRRKGGKIEMIQGTEDIDPQQRLIEVFKEADYQDIVVKRQGGKMVSIKRTIKHKPTSKATGQTRASSTEPIRSSNKSKSKAVRSNAHH